MLEKFSMRYPAPPTKQGYVKINQGFAENEENYYAQLGLMGHNGLDLNTTARWHKGEAPIYAAHDGYVISDATKDSDTAGRRVKLITDEVEIDGKPCKVMTLYFHLKSARVSVTDPLESPWFDYGTKQGKERYVRAGTLIGTSDNTGRFTTGPHLHFGMYILWKDANGGYSVNASNGYGGSNDPLPYFQDDMVFNWYQGWFTPARWFINGKEVDRKTASIKAQTIARNII